MKPLLFAFSMVTIIQCYAQENDFRGKFKVKKVLQIEGDMGKLVRVAKGGELIYCHEIAGVGPVLNKRKHGNWKFFNCNGDVSFTAEFYNGRRIGVWVDSLYDSYRLYSVFKDGTATIKTFDYKDRIKEILTITLDEKGRKNYKTEYYSSKGTLIRTKVTDHKRRTIK